MNDMLNGGYRKGRVIEGGRMYNLTPVSALKDKYLTESMTSQII
jgi:hypothetical protein